MDLKERSEFWSKVSELVPPEEKQIKSLIEQLQKHNADPVKAQSSFLRFFDFIANEATPNKQWSEKIWNLFDRLNEGE